MKYILCVILCATVLYGCMASVSDVLTAREKGEGMTVAYPVSFDSAWEISRTVFRWEKTEAIEEHRLEGYMLTSAGQNFISAGSVMGAFIETVDSLNVKVTIISKRKMATNLATGLNESTFHKRFAQAVEIVKAGKKLPLTPPD